jgi:hypothetical protein
MKEFKQKTTALFKAVVYLRLLKLCCFWRSSATVNLNGFYFLAKALFAAFTIFSAFKPYF